MKYIKMELNGASYLVNPKDESRIQKLEDIGYEIIVDNKGIPLTVTIDKSGLGGTKLNDKTKSILDKLNIEEEETPIEPKAPIVNQIFTPAVNVNNKPLEYKE